MWNGVVPVLLIYLCTIQPSYDKGYKPLTSHIPYIPPPSMQLAIGSPIHTHSFHQNIIFFSSSSAWHPNYSWIGIGGVWKLHKMVLFSLGRYVA